MACTPKTLHQEAEKKFKKQKHINEMSCKLRVVAFWTELKRCHDSCLVFTIVCDGSKSDCKKRVKTKKQFSELFQTDHHSSPFLSSGLQNHKLHRHSDLSLQRN